MSRRVAPVRRILAIWLPRLGVEAALRHAPVPGPFALIAQSGNVERLAGVNAAAAAGGLRPGMALADARALLPGLATRPADALAEAAALTALLRWAGHFSPWVGREADGLVLDLTGSAHLFGGEAAVMVLIRRRLARAGLTARLALAPTRGAAHALARHAGRGRDDAPLMVLAAEDLPAALGPLPPAALRLDPGTCATLARLGLRDIAALAALPRAPTARRLGPQVMQRLDQAFGRLPEPVTPEAAPPIFAVRLTLPEPIGLVSDLSAGLARLLARLCERLEAQGQGATLLVLEARRVDGSPQRAVIRLARPMRDAAVLARLFAPRLEEVEAGFGIDTLRLLAPETASLPAEQLRAGTGPARAAGDALADLVTRFGNRLGFEAVTRFQPAESHLPERSFQIVEARFAATSGSDAGGSDAGGGDAAGDPAGGDWHLPAPRPLTIFPPEPLLETGAPVQAVDAAPPPHFRWRRMRFTLASVSGPERIAPEWWFDHPAWRSGPRDYWRAVTGEGRMLWLFRSLGEPGWWVEGEFA